MEASDCTGTGPICEGDSGSQGAVERVAVLGAGAWGTALAHHLASHGRNVSLWARREEHARSISDTRENSLLPGISVDPNLVVSSQLASVLDGASLVVVASPCHSVRNIAEQVAPLVEGKVLWVSAAKGIENKRLLLPTEILSDVLGAGGDHDFVALSGPSFAREVALGMPTSLVAAGTDWGRTERVQRVFSAGAFRVYASGDPIGVQMAGALKNVIAIAVGASDGLGLGNNARAALVTRALAEVARLVAARGGEAATVAGLAGLGDLVLTCTGELSRNRKVGLELGKGRGLEQVLNGLGHVAEGVTTARSVKDLGNELDVDLPICTEVWRVLYDGKKPRAAVDDLLSRPLKRE